MGVAIRRYGTKRILSVSMTINCLSCIFTPLVVFKFGSYGMMALRALQGLAQGSIVPALYNVLAHWVPPSERSFLGAYGWSGSMLGLILAMPITGFLCSASWGWPSSFYFNGAIGFVWLVPWILLAADTPYNDKFISEAEKIYITSSFDPKEEIQHKGTPWKAILTSLPFLGITLSQFGSNWGDNISLTEMPFYISKILKYDIEANGIISALPFVASLILGFAYGYVADAIVNKKLMTLGMCRKMFVAISCLGPAVCLISLSFLPESATVLSCLMMILHQSFSAAYYGGISMNYMDISPNYCAILVSITNAICTICDIVVPLLVQVVITDETDKGQWQIIFLMAAAMYIFAAIAYIFLGSVETQSWDYADNLKSSPEKKNSECNFDENKI
ncbi:unnamed protein product [Callosobruchus maculatus]|uniref:Major facilitator superfamily (MFS) profile domain-containing protein n=2 Tax=Callosobruchus maculatus TaxID=64391 RepID=A0A653CAP9_CALMS|nr:unnamed protein product [Callosobruchus maculatus]